MAKKFPLLLVLILVVAVVFILFEAGFFNDLVGPAPAPGGSKFSIGVVSGSVAAVGGSPAISVGATSTSISGSQATMGSVTSISMKLTVTHLSGAGARAFDLVLNNPSYNSPSGGGLFTVYDKDAQGCPMITMSVDSGGSGAASCVGGSTTFHGVIDVSGGTITISATFTMQEQLWQAGGGNPPVGTSLDAAITAIGASDYHIIYTRSS